MNPDEILTQATELLGHWIRWSKSTQINTLTVSISRKHLVDAVRTLLDGRWGYLTAITGLHIPGVNVKTASLEKNLSRTEESVEGNTAAISQPCGSFLVLYHFCSGPVVLTLRVHPPSLDDARVPSICEVIPSATLYERELIEMFGLEVTGTPNTSRLLLPDDWPDGLYPLRKDFDASLLSQKA